MPFPGLRGTAEPGRAFPCGRRRTLIWNQRHLLHALREFEQFYNCHRPHQGIANARPLQAPPQPPPPTDVDACLHIHRHDRLGGILHDYQHAALPARM
jgi:putative transposase